MLEQHYLEGQMPERVVVLGKSGFVASAAIESMAGEGFRIKALGAEK